MEVVGAEIVQETYTALAIILGLGTEVTAQKTCTVQVKIMAAGGGPTTLGIYEEQAITSEEDIVVIVRAIYTERVITLVVDGGRIALVIGTEPEAIMVKAGVSEFKAKNLHSLVDIRTFIVQHCFDHAPACIQGGFGQSGFYHGLA